MQAPNANFSENPQKNFCILIFCVHGFSAPRLSSADIPNSAAFLLLFQAAWFAIFAISITQAGRSRK